VTSSGIRRKVDDLGRVVIPASIRRSLGIREGDAVEVSVEGERVVLAKPRESCVFCGREEQGLTTFRGRLLCRECLGGLGVLDERTRITEQAERSEQAEPVDVPAPTRAPTAAPTAPPAPTSPPAPAAPTASRSAPTSPATPSPSPAAPRPVRAVREPRDRPAGPIDGDAWARARARDDDEPPPRRRPPQDPASTTAW
jgi:AbrB family transcriptional regulator, transcriptional pleiotropic regulator of transition state genes